MELSNSTWKMVASSDYWSHESAMHLRRMGGPVQTDRLIYDIFKCIYELTELIPTEKYLSSLWCMFFERNFTLLFDNFRITCDVYAFDSKIESYEFDESSIKKLRFYSCLPLMNEMSNCLKSALSSHKTALEESKKITKWGFSRIIPFEVERKAKTLLNWWDDILAKNNGIIPETPELNITEDIKGCNITNDIWKERTETLKLYVEERKKGKNPAAHLESYL
jgi:hypothetical protein